ncbi:primosomal replication protein N (plasmid) [Burkholderia sp. SFA1]|nr:primosomal replication protein N [Burkholderia sp. SFA1]
MNRLQLTASVVEREPVRYPLAGVSIASRTLQHAAEVVEAGIARQIEVTLQAVAAGEASGRLESSPIGVETCFTGFLATKSRYARTLVSQNCRTLERTRHAPPDW